MKKNISAPILASIGLVAATLLTAGALVAAKSFQTLEQTSEQSLQQLPKKVTLLALGDSGGNNVHQKKIAALLDSTNSDAIIHTGDIAYLEGTLLQLTEQYDAIYSAKVKEKVHPTPGNHDYVTASAGPYLSYFGTKLASYNAQQNGRYYSTDVGRVHLVSLDTNTSLTSPVARAQMKAWLNDDLKALYADKVVVVFFHEPPFAGNTNHASNELVLKELVPIFDQYNVGFVLSGHNHNYLRTCPLVYSKTGEQCQTQGTTYIVTGGGGKELYPFKQPTPAYVAKQASVFHFVKIEIMPNGSALLNVIDENGALIETIRI